VFTSVPTGITSANRFIAAEDKRPGGIPFPLQSSKNSPFAVFTFKNTMSRSKGNAFSLLAAGRLWEFTKANSESHFMNLKHSARNIAKS
jgi:hypothetical protein